MNHMNPYETLARRECHVRCFLLFQHCTGRGAGQWPVQPTLSWMVDGLSIATTKVDEIDKTGCILLPIKPGRNWIVSLIKTGCQPHARCELLLGLGLPLGCSKQPKGHSSDAVHSKMASFDMFWGSLRIADGNYLAPWHNCSSQLESLRSSHAQDPTTSVLVLSGAPKSTELKRFFRAKATGWVLGFEAHGLMTGQWGQTWAQPKVEHAFLQNSSLSLEWAAWAYPTVAEKIQKNRWTNKKSMAFTGCCCMFEFVFTPTFGRGWVSHFRDSLGTSPV